MIKMFVLKYNVIALKDIFIILMINVIMLEKSLKLIVLQALLNFQDVPKSLLKAVQKNVQAVKPITSLGQEFVILIIAFRKVGLLVKFVKLDTLSSKEHAQDVIVELALLQAVFINAVLVLISKQVFAQQYLQ